MELNIGFDFNQNQAIERLRRHWDKKLSPRANKKYPLAPKDLVGKKIVTAENYHLENSAFGTFCSSIMEAEFKGMDFESTKSTVEVLGAGLSRDLDWVRAVALVSEVNIRDISEVACDLARKYFKDFIVQERVNVHCDEIEENLNYREIDADESVVYFGSQFIQVQNQTKMRKIMKRIGSILDNPLSTSYPLRRLYLMHPYGVDNETPRAWGFYDMPGVRWGDTTPYSESGLLSALQKGSSKVVKVTVLGKHSYYHQTYSLIRFETSR